MFLLLGDIGLAKLTSPTDMDLRRAYSYPEHLVAEGKPLMQFTGTALDEINLSLLIHADFAVPQTMWDDLTALSDRHDAFPLSQGNGLLLGWFVITEISRTTTVAAADGTLLAIEVKLGLKEYVDPDRLQARRTRQLGDATGRKADGKKVGGIKTIGIPYISEATRAADYTAVGIDRILRRPW